MKNTKETLEAGKFYTTRMSDCTTRQYEFDLEGYVISIKGYPNYFASKRVFDPNKEKKFFVRGKGWTNLKPNNITPVTVPVVTTYAQLLELVQKYGYRCACQMVGFDLESYGNHYPISDIAKMETFGAPYVEYLERIASIDGKILNYLCTVMKLKVKGFSYDMWLEQGENETYKCEFRTNPFLGFHLQTCLFGMIPMRPNIDPVSWDSDFLKVVMQFHPEYVHDWEDTEKYSELKTKFDRVSCKGWIEVMCGKEDADWLSENLTFKGEPIAKDSDLDTTPSQIAALSVEVKSKRYKAIKGS